MFTPGLGITNGPRSLHRRPHTYQHIPLKNRLRLSRCEFFAGYLLLQILRNRRELASKRSESVFQWDVWIGVGSSSETAGSLHNPQTRCTPSYWGMSEAFEMKCYRRILNTGSFSKNVRHLTLKTLKIKRIGIFRFSFVCLAFSGKISQNISRSCFVFGAVLI